MKEKIKFVHDIICLNFDINQTFMIITETEGTEILRSYNVKMPDYKKYEQNYFFYTDILN
jgi:hypothetical protein